MSYDGLMMHHVIKELREALVKGRITKIYQLSSFDLLFTVRRVKNQQLLMSTSSAYTRLHLTKNTYEKPAHPPMFCMFLRKHLEGGIIHDITQHGNDRVALFTLQKINELGDIENKYLVFEALGKDSNIVVLNHEMHVLDALKHTGPFEANLRTIAPGAKYVFPEDDRINPYDEAQTKDAFKTLDLTDRKGFLSTFSGVSPQFVNAYLSRRTLNKDPYALFKDMIHETRYQIYQGKKPQYSFYDFSDSASKSTYYDTLTDLFDAYFYERDISDKRKQKAKDLTQFIHRQVNKLKTKLEALKNDLKAATTSDNDKLYGELILGYQHNIKKGDRVLTCDNYYTNEPVDIPLDPKKTPIENSEKYFKRYKKRKKSVPYIKREITRAENDLEYFLLLESQVEHASLNDLEEMRDELIEGKYLKAKTKKVHRKKAQKIMVYKDALGVEIMVGKNNIQNAYITHEASKHFYVWFHVQNAPGSHVVVKAGFPLEETTIRTAAMLAAYYSKLKLSSSVPVDYTEIKRVKKIPTKHACFVRFTDQKTIYIDPEESFVQSLDKVK